MIATDFSIMSDLMSMSGPCIGSYSIIADRADVAIARYSDRGVSAYSMGVLRIASHSHSVSDL